MHQRSVEADNAGGIPLETLISIVTPTYNVKEELLDTLLCVSEIKRLDPSIEYLIIDGNSQDGTLELITEYHRKGVVDRFISERDSGVYNALNKGIKMSAGKYILIVGAGDTLVPSKFKKVMEIVREEAPDVVYGDQLMIDPETKKVRRCFIPGPFSIEKLNFGWHPPHASTLVRADLLKSIGGFDERYRIASDIKMHWQVFSKANTVVYVPEVLSIFRLGGMSNASLKNIVKANVESYRIAKELKFKFPAFVVLGKMLWKTKMKFLTPFVKIDEEVRQFLERGVMRA